MKAAIRPARWGLRSVLPGSARSFSRLSNDLVMALVSASAAGTRVAGFAELLNASAASTWKSAAEARIARTGPRSTT